MLQVITIGVCTAIYFSGIYVRSASDLSEDNFKFPLTELAG